MRALSPQRVVAAIALVGVVAFSANTAEATSIRLTQGATVITVADGDVGPPADSNPAADAITFIGVVGSFNINVTTGLANPATPFPELLHLNSVDTSSSAGGTLKIEFSQTGYNYLNPPFESIYAVFAPFIPLGATLKYEAYYDTTNTLFGQGTQIGSELTAAGTTFGQAPLAGPYSVTQVVTITHAGAQTSSFDASIQVSESGTTVSLLGLGLIFVGLATRKMLV